MRRRVAGNQLAFGRYYYLQNFLIMLEKSLILHYQYTGSRDEMRQFKWLFLTSRQ